MKAVYYTTVFSIILLLSPPASADTLVVPYKIKNPSSSFPAQLSTRYAKLLAVAASIKKDIDVYSFRQLELDFNNLSINPQKRMTSDDLVMLGKSTNVDHVMLGSLSKTREYYMAESMLYSVKDNRIISRSYVKSRDLFGLAEEDVDKIFFKISGKVFDADPAIIDVTYLIDLSYNVLKDWDSVKKGILEFSKTISDNWSINTKINIIPSSNNYSIGNDLLGLDSHLKIERKLNDLSPRGKCTTKIFENAIGYSINNVHWRREADKILIVISNSSSIKGNFLERYAMNARRKGIVINTVSLGLMKPEAIETLRQLSVISKGNYRAVAYHQRLYNSDGKAIDIFMEGGRLFHSLIHDNSWRQGLLVSIDENKSLSLRRPISFVDEIFYNSSDYKINPYNMLKYYPRLTRTNIINSTKLENNIGFLMERVGGTFLESASGQAKKIIGKAMISDGDISIWIKINDQKVLDYFKKRKSLNQFSPIGLIVQKNASEPYGITFSPNCYITELPGDYIPDAIKTRFRSIVGKPDYYMSNGLLRPPVWFVNVKVERVERYKKVYDIREIKKP